MQSHGAVASYALGEEVWEAVAADWRTAPVRAELTRRARVPREADAPSRARSARRTPARVRAAGVSDEALRDAITVCALFSMIVRLADSLGWDLPSPERLRGRAPAMLEGGYALEAVSGR